MHLRIGLYCIYIFTKTFIAYHLYNFEFYLVFRYYFFENENMDTVEQELTCPWFFGYWDYQYAL